MTMNNVDYIDYIILSHLVQLVFDWVIHPAVDFNPMSLKYEVFNYKNKHY